MTTSGVDTSGGTAGDTITGGFGPGPLLGTSGNDTIDVSASYTLIDGLAGDDVIRATGVAFTVLGGLGNDSISAGSNDDLSVDGGDGDDIIYAQGSGHVIVAGGAGGDVIQVSFGHATIDGGPGDDNLIASDSVTFTFEWSQDAAGYHNQSGTDVISIFQPVHGDRIEFTGVDPADFLRHVTVTDYVDHVDLAYGGAVFLHVYNWTPFSSNWFIGGDTAPPLPVTIVGRVLDDSLQGGDANDTITGGGGRDTIFGGNGDDSIATGADHSVVNGNQGQDTIIGRSEVGDWLSGGQGNDVIELSASTGNNIVNGNRGQDTVIGGLEGDTLRGGQGDDVIRGGPGGDRIFGDQGADTLTGGAGADRFQFAYGFGADQITDFDGVAGGDRIVLSGPVTGYQITQAGSDVTIVLNSGVGDVVTLRNQTVPFQSDWILLSG
jgi:Ca2+-binding RTX toxin-like protein